MGHMSHYQPAHQCKHPQIITSIQKPQDENTEITEVDTSEQQVPVANTDFQVHEEQQEPEIPEDQTSRASQDDNYQTAIDDDEQDNTIQFGNPVTQPFLLS